MKMAAARSPRIVDELLPDYTASYLILKINFVETSDLTTMKYAFGARIISPDCKMV
jgi:hypothetical protein